MFDVLLVGPYPPPIGGVSTHVSRLAQLLEEAGLHVGVLNHFKTRGSNRFVIGSLHRNPLRYWYEIRQADASVVHYHHARWSTLVATAIALARADRPASVIS